MKKILLLALLLFPCMVFAAEPKVLTVETKVVGNTVNFEGTAEDGVTAVMCKLFDEDDNEVDKVSTEVDTNKFAEVFENVDKGTYKVSCAKYEGGDIVSAEAVVTATSNPQTYDGGIVTSIIILLISIIGIVGAAIYLNNKKKVNSN